MKILVCHATAGAGHKKAAEALFLILQKNPRYDVKIVDILDYTLPFYKNCYQKSYTFLISRASWLWGFCFWLTDQKGLQGLIRHLRRLSNSHVAKPFAEFLKDEQFDCIFSTHFFPNEVAGYLKRNGYILSKVISVITDFDVHRMWVSEGVDIYTAASDTTKAKLVQLGVLEDHIRVTGIPVDQKFAVSLNREELQNKLGIQKGIFTVLIATGSFGIGPIRQIMEGLKGVQALVICGNNKKLFDDLSRIKKEFLHVYGHVNNMDELMSVSDCMVTKPGGLSISEALVKNLPVIFFSAIPGQETNNVRILASHGVGLKADGVSAIVQDVDRLKNQPPYFQDQKEKTKAIARPAAAVDITALIS